MIKVIAFDLVGVLVKEKDIVLSNDEDKIERLFGPNRSDEEFFLEARKILPNKDISLLANNIISKLYEIREKDLINKLKDNYPSIKLVVATNHISLIRKYIESNFSVSDIIISGEINKIKPNEDFYNYLINKLGIKNNELLFIDDNDNNIIFAKKLGINTIKVDKDTNIYREIIERINNENN
jgi:putative hydrolase of the HAD superfamily